MYELRKGLMVLFTPSIENAKMYEKAGWKLVEKKKKNKTKQQEISTEEVQAVANAIVEQATEDNKTVDEIVTEIVKEETVE